MKKRIVFIVFIAVFLSITSCQEQKNIEKESIASNDSDNLTTDKTNPDYRVLEQKRYGKGGLTIKNMYLWDDSILIETGDDFYIFSEDSEYLSRLQIKGIGKILDVVMHKGMAYAIGIDEKGYELKYKKGNEWISQKLPDELENSFDVSPVTLLSDLETLVVMNKSDIYKFADSKWSKIQIPKIDFEIGEYSPDVVSSRSMHFIQLLNNTIFVGWDFGEWGGGLMELDISDDPAKWKKTVINTEINSIVKDNDRNIWVGASIGYAHAGVFKYDDGKWESIFPEKFLVNGHYYKFAREESPLEFLIVSGNDTIPLLAGSPGVFKYQDGQTEKLINRKNGAFFPHKAVLKNDHLFMVSWDGIIINFKDNKPVSTVLKIKEKKYDDSIMTNVRTGKLADLKSLLKTSSFDYNWETMLITQALISKRFDIAKYLINKSKIIHRCSNCLDLSLTDMATLKTLLKKGYKIKLSDIGPKFYDKTVKKYLLKNVKIIDETQVEVEYRLKHEDDLELLQFYLNNGYTLKDTSKCSFPAIHDSVLDGNKKKISFLISNGADINERMKDCMNTGATPLIFAVRQGDLEMVKFLLEKGAYVTLSDATGNTPLFYAKNKGEGISLFVGTQGIVIRKGTADDYKLIESFLLNAEKNITEEEKTAVSKLVDKYRLEPKHAQLLDAIKNKNTTMINQLLSSGFDITVLDKFDINIFDKKKTSVLRYALSIDRFRIEDRRIIMTEGEECSYSLEIFKILVNHSIKTTGKIFDEQNLLEHAAYCGSLDVLEYLIKNGADINVKDQFGRTLAGMLFASSHDKKAFQSAKFLIINGADLNIVFDDGKTLLDYRYETHENNELADLVISKGGKTGKELKKMKVKRKK